MLQTYMRLGSSEDETFSELRTEPGNALAAYCRAVRIARGRTCSIRRMGGLFIGTSGWVYRGWAGSFYPEGCPAARQFSFYSARFRTVADFNNDWNARAPKNASEFIQLVSGAA